MRWTDSGDRYGVVSVAMHWLVAALVVTMLGLGFYSGDLPEGPHRDQMLGLHKSLGIVTAAAVVARIGWRLRVGFVALVATLAGWQRKAARINHVALLVAAILMPLTGYLQGVEVSMFGLAPIPAVHDSDAVSEVMGAIHSVTANALSVLILVHIAAALKHHYFDRDDTLRRMLGR